MDGSIKLNYGEKDIIKSKPIELRDAGVEGFLKEARERAKTATTAWKDNFASAEEDVLFAYGEQWDDAAKRERMQEGRPTLTLNKMGQYIYRLIGDQRQNVQTIKFHAVQGNSNAKMQNTAGTKDYSVSQVYEAITRNIEITSNANYHYKTAYQHAVEGGFGWLRVLTDYSQSDSFELDLKIESVRNRWSVVVDPYSKEPDYSDMNYAFISERISREEFNKRYPDKRIGELQGADADTVVNWSDENTIKVSEYFVRRPITKELVLMTNGETYWYDDVKPVLDELAGQGVTIQRQRKVQTWKVEWYKITAWDILEGPKQWCGTTIPIAPVLGKEIDVKGQRYFRGVINEAKDAQRMLNYWQSAATERVALAPKSPWVADARSIEDYQEIWKSANIKNWSVLPYKAVAGINPPTRQDPPSMPSAELQIATLAEEGIKSSIGIYDAMLGNKSQEQSGRAIIARQQQGDTATYIFTDNLVMAQRRIGRILCEAIPVIYDSNRIIRLAFPDGSGDFVEINKTIRDEQTGMDVVIHDLSTGKYDVVVETGPQYSTQRQASQDAIMQLAQVIPQVAQVAPDIIAMNVDAPNMSVLSDRLKKTIPTNMLSKEDQEEFAKDAPPPQPTPEQQQAQIEMQSAQQEQQFNLQMQQLKLQEAQLKFQTEQLKAQQSVQPEREEKEEGHEDETQDKAMIQEMVNEAVSEALAQYIASQRGV